MRHASLWAIAAAPALLTLGMTQPAAADDGQVAGEGDDQHRKRHVIVVPADGEKRAHALKAHGDEHGVLVVPKDGKHPRLVLVEEEENQDDELKRALEMLKRLGEGDGDDERDVLRRVRELLEGLGRRDRPRARVEERRVERPRVRVERPRVRVERRDDREPVKVKIRIQVGDQVIEEEYELGPDGEPRDRRVERRRAERRRPERDFRGGPFRWNEDEDERRHFFMPRPRRDDDRGEREGFERYFEELERFFDRDRDDRGPRFFERRDRGDDRPRFFFERRDRDDRRGRPGFPMPFGRHGEDFDFERLPEMLEGLKGLKDLEKLKDLEGLEDIEKTIEKALEEGFEGFDRMRKDGELEKLFEKMPPEAREWMERFGKQRHEHEERREERRPQRRRGGLV